MAYNETPTKEPMFTKATQPEAQLDSAITRAFVALESKNVVSDDYGRILDRIVKLQKLKDESTPKPVSKDTLAMIAANLTGIVIVLGHERVNVITTKALSLAMKLR